MIQLENHMFTIAEPMKKILREKKISLTVLCEESKVVAQHINGYENGELEPTLADFIAIAEALHVSLDELAGRESYTEMERDLVSSFRELNDEGQEVAGDLVFSMRLAYKKNSKDGMVAA